MGEGLLIYGSYGYAGDLIAREAVGRGLSPVLAGRRSEPLERQATDLGLDHRVFSLEYSDVVEEQIADCSAVLNCAGPFSGTADRLSNPCLRVGTDYLDIAGEIPVLEAIAERDREAEKRGVTLLPAVGFNVVPTDCLASYLETRLPSSSRLTLAIDGFRTVSPGTMKSIIEGMSTPGAIREDGELRVVPAAWKTRRIDFGSGPKPAVTVPWGDVSTAYYATGIPNIETYATFPKVAIEVMRRTRPIVPALGTNPLQWILKEAVDAFVSGPTARERAQTVIRVLGAVEDDEGNRITALLRTPDTYEVASRTAVEAARRTLEGDVGPGFQTPASAFGPDFALEFDGIEISDRDGAFERVRPANEGAERRRT